MDEGFARYAQDGALKPAFGDPVLVKNVFGLPFAFRSVTLPAPSSTTTATRPAARLPLGRPERPVVVAARRHGDPDERLREDGAHTRFRRTDAPVPKPGRRS